MIKAYAVLGQVNPAASSATALYTSPASTQTVCSSLTVTNTGTDGVISTYDIAVVPTGQSLSTRHYIRRKAPLDCSDSVSITIGITLGAGDAVWVSASSANLAFSLFGSKGT